MHYVLKSENFEKNVVYLVIFKANKLKYELKDVSDTLCPKGQLISEWTYDVIISPKKERNFLRISDLASKY